MDRSIVIPQLTPVLGPTIHDRLRETLSILLPENAINAHYPQDPLVFVNDVLGIKTWTAQEEIIDMVWNNRYSSVASCHGIGKTEVCAALVLTFLHLHENSIVLSTAPTGRQVEQVLWRRVRRMHRRARRPLLGRNVLTLRYDISEEWYGMGFKPADAETDPTQGFHAERVLVIIDEAAGAPATIIDGLHAAMTTAESRFVMIGNPTSISGPFYDSHHSKSDGYATLNVSWEDTPNFRAGKTIMPYLITQEWVDETIAKYGEDSPYVQSRVYARWVPQEGVLIPLALIEAARDRQWDDIIGLDEYTIEAGLDVARQGEDRSVLTIRQGPVVLGQWIVPGRDSFETAGSTLNILREQAGECDVLKIDVVGIGAGVLDVIERATSDQHARMRVVPVNLSKSPADPEKYRLQRDEAYGGLADRFRWGNIAGKIHDTTVADLSDLRAKYDTKHTQPVIEPKDDFKKRIGRSPDFGDSLALAFYNPPVERDQSIGALAFGAAKQKWGRI